MALLKDSILGLGQRIDGKQAPSLPIPGNTLLDSTIPPPPPPPFRPTIHQDHTVPPPPPPLVQPTPQTGAFFLHGHTQTKPHSIVAPALVVDHTQAHIDRIEQRMRLLHIFFMEL